MRRTQCDRVLALSSRDNGVCSAELVADPPDGAKPITRLAARIWDLEQKGYVFEILHDRKSTRVYRLIEVERTSGTQGSGRAPHSPRPNRAAAGSLSPEGRLFEPAPNPHWKEAA